MSIWHKAPQRQGTGVLGGELEVIAVTDMFKEAEFSDSVDPAAAAVQVLMESGMVALAQGAASYASEEVVRKAVKEVSKLAAP